MKKVEKLTYRTIHTDYLRFAVLSYLESSREASGTGASPYVNRQVIDSIRYSFDCLEGAIKFVYFAGLASQLPIEVPSNWLTQYLRRQWGKLSLADSIGLLSFAWTGEPFWQTSEQFQLFEDLRKLRGGLTHPRPVGTRVSRLADDTTVEELLEPEFLVHSTPIAEFHRTPESLDHSDAEQALEILLHHLVRIQRLFLHGTFSTLFAYYDDAKKEIIGSTQLLQRLHCRFSRYWQQDVK
jgi:hypothetical protein